VVIPHVVDMKVSDQKRQGTGVISLFIVDVLINSIDRVEHNSVFQYIGAEPLAGSGRQ
jgi:hypothetical protein